MMVRLYYYQIFGKVVEAEVEGRMKGKQDKNFFFKVTSLLVTITISNSNIYTITINISCYLLDGSIILREMLQDLTPSKDFLKITLK